MATGFLRQGLRDEEVHRIVRRMRTLVQEGVGPEEAWQAATGAIVGVDPGSFKGWKEEILRRVSEAGPLDPTASRTNLYTRTAELSEKLAETQRKLADAGARIEQLTNTDVIDTAVQAAVKTRDETIAALNSKLNELEADRSEKGAKLAEAQMQLDRVVIEAKQRLAAKDEEIAKLNEQLDAANELLTNPKKK